MTDINLKTLTPDTSLPTTGFLFGADSQASTNPSVYSTQTVATTLLGSTSLTGDTLTVASAPVLNMAQTWNNGAVTFTGWKLNVTRTNAAATSKYIDVQIDSATHFSIRRGSVNGDAAILESGPSNWLVLSGNSQGISLQGNSIEVARISSSGFNFEYAASRLSWNSDLFLSRKGAANLQLGAADAATALAQTLSVQSVVAGTSNTAGAAFTITGAQGTGTGAGGSIIFQTAAANSGGGAGIQNTLADAMVIDSVKTVRLGTGYTVATLPAAGTAGRRTYVTDALAPVYLGTLTGGGAVVCPVFDNGTAWVSA